MKANFADSFRRFAVTIFGAAACFLSAAASPGPAASAPVPVPDLSRSHPAGISEPPLAPAETKVPESNVSLMLGIATAIGIMGILRKRKMS